MFHLKLKITTKTNNWAREGPDIQDLLKRKPMFGCFCSLGAVDDFAQYGKLPAICFVTAP